VGEGGVFGEGEGLGVVRRMLSRELRYGLPGAWRGASKRYILDILDHRYASYEGIRRLVFGSFCHSRWVAVRESHWR
jgi:hypothetical protein